MFANSFVAFFENLSLYNWIDILVVIIAIVFVIYGIMHGISGGISKLSAYLTTFGVGLWMYNFIRDGWLVDNTYPNKIGAFVLAGLAGLLIGVCIGLLVAKCLRIIVSQPYDAILGVLGSLICYCIIVLGVLFLLRLTPTNTEKIKEQSFTGMMGYTILDGVMAESTTGETPTK
ncbi:MAG: CvpA family protein [Kiritimatiellae bacterium]|nr:CvpA family protein [Kiritimatiellia bacterium]